MYEDKPESKTVADKASIDVVEVIITDCSPDSNVIDLQSSFIALCTPYQPDICTPASVKAL